MPFDESLIFSAFGDVSFIAKDPFGRFISIGLPNNAVIRVCPKGEMRPGGGKADNESWICLDRTGVIWLAKETESSSVRYEAFRAAMDMVLTDSERILLEKQFGSREDAAEAYALWCPRREAHKSKFNKIRGFFTKVRSSLFPSAEDIFEKVDTGKAWGRELRLRGSYYVEEALFEHQLILQKLWNAFEYDEAEVWANRVESILNVGTGGRNVRWLAREFPGDPKLGQLLEARRHVRSAEAEYASMRGLSAEERREVMAAKLGSRHVRQFLLEQDNQMETIKNNKTEPDDGLTAVSPAT